MGIFSSTLLSFQDQRRPIVFVFDLRSLEVRGLEDFHERDQDRTVYFYAYPGLIFEVLSDGSVASLTLCPVGRSAGKRAPEVSWANSGSADVSAQGIRFHMYVVCQGVFVVLSNRPLASLTLCPVSAAGAQALERQKCLGQTRVFTPLQRTLACGVFGQSVLERFETFPGA